jgi:sugar transferase (PEP-CTERM/EpsH1 system associated)
MKILVLDEEFPYPLNTGKRIRSYNLISRLAKTNELRYLAYGTPDSENFAVFQRERMNPIAVQRVLPPKSGPMFYVRLLKNLFSLKPYIVTSHYSQEFESAMWASLNEWQPDIILCEWTPYAAFASNVDDFKKVVVAHNIETTIWQRYYQTERQPFKRWYIGRQVGKVSLFERHVFNWVNGATAVSIPEAEMIKGIAPDLDIEVVDNGVDLEFFADDGAGGNIDELVFTGSMDWRPNQDAILYFVDEIFPRLRELYPDIKATIVGRNPPTFIKELERVDGVTITGTVDDVRSYMRKAAIYIVPLRIGGGSRLKILEAFAMRKAVVSTTIGAEGLNTAEQKELLIADEPEEFVKVITRLREDKSLRQALGLAGRKLVEQQYGWDILAERLNTFLARIASRS